MRHLKSEELIDLAEAARPESSAPHLQACGECRRRVEDLRAMMAAAAEVDVPEPSPLFWDHLSARVHEAIAAEEVPRRPSWLTRFALPLSAAACAASVVIAVVVMSSGGWRHVAGLRPAVSVASLSPLADDGIGAELPALPDDPSMDLVADLAAEVDWDGDVASSLGTHADVADTVVDQLSAGERRELQQLLKEVLAHPGA